MPLSTLLVVSWQMCHAWNTYGLASRAVLVMSRLHYTWNYLTCVTESCLMDKHAQWTDMQPKLCTNHFLVRWQCLICKKPIHQACESHDCAQQPSYISNYSKCTQQQYYMGNMILARSSQDHPNIQDHGQDPQRWDLSVQFYICGTQT